VFPLIISWGTDIYTHIRHFYLLARACKRLFHNQKIFNAISTENHILRAHITLHLLSSVFTIRLYVPFLSPLMHDTRSFMVVRQDIAVTLYVRQGRAPANRSGCATLRSIAKDCIEKIGGYIR